MRRRCTGREDSRGINSDASRTDCAGEHASLYDGIALVAFHFDLVVTAAVIASCSGSASAAGAAVG